MGGRGASSPSPSRWERRQLMCARRVPQELKGTNLALFLHEEDTHLYNTPSTVPTTAFAAKKILHWHPSPASQKCELTCRFFSSLSFAPRSREECRRHVLGTGIPPLFSDNQTCWRMTRMHVLDVRGAVSPSRCPTRRRMVTVRDTTCLTPPPRPVCGRVQSWERYCYVRAPYCSSSPHCCLYY
eukprot:gene25676-biopygen9048